MQQTGSKRVERLLQVWVVVEEQLVSQVRQLVAKYGKLLGQEFMYFEVSDATVDFIPPFQPENGQHD